MHAVLMHTMAYMRIDNIRTSYMTYITDSIRLHGEGMYPVSRWADLVQAQDAHDDIDAGAIVDDVIARGGLRVAHEPS